MVVIRIQQRETGRQDHTQHGSEETEPMEVVVSFDYGLEYAARVHDPFGEDASKEHDLEWYFEEYLTFPFTEKVRKEHAEQSIRAYGEVLFEQVFAEERARQTYREVRRREGMYGLRFEIVGSVAFQRLHWEALYDAELGEYLALGAVMVRRNVVEPKVQVVLKTMKTINVLLVVARPVARFDVAYRTISRPLVDLVEKLELPVEVTLVRPGTFSALQKHLEQVSRERGVGYYQVVHFDVHGGLLSYEEFCRSGEQEKQEGVDSGLVYKVKRPAGLSEIKPYEGKRAFLSLEREDAERSGLVEAEEIGRLLTLHQIPVAILNACQSARYEGETDSSLGNRLVQAGVQTVVAMGYSVTVSAAERLMQTLYEEMFQRKRLSEAMSVARRSLSNDKERRAYYNQRIELEDWLLPIVYENQEVYFETLAMTWGEEKAFWQTRADLYLGKRPEYGFVGRDVDILEIEKRLLLQRNVLLVRGMGGVGKTTLLQYLARWWQRTGLVHRVFYFGYDERAWSRQQIMDTIARGMLGEEEWQRSFRLLPSVQAKLLKLAGVLKRERHLLILDNLESITGSALAIRHTLSKKEQGCLQELLAQLVGGETLVLLGSRGAEQWLAPGTFEGNRYELGGLDDEAASLLAEKILAQHRATKYRGDRQVRALIKLLDGFPLALQVVLANLERQTPEQVMQALQAGSVDLNVGSSQQRTENILTCVDYSYSNLAQEAQQLLLCLAPFTSVVRIDTLHRYAERLKEQQVLAQVDAKQWDQVIAEAIRWGLLTLDEELSIFAHMQPTLAYFLRSRLAGEGQQERKRAIEQAFYAYYAEMSGAIDAAMESKEANAWQVGGRLAQFEYENVLHALCYAVQERVAVYDLYRVLSTYLDRRQEYQRGEAIDTLVLRTFEGLTDEELVGAVGEECVRVLIVAGNRQLALRHYEKAKMSYQRTIHLLAGKVFSEQQRDSNRAGLYHQLGRLAEEEQKWEEARSNYEQALRIFEQYEDHHNHHNHYNQARIYHALGMVEQGERNWEAAKSNYEQALHIFEQYGDRYSLANTYHQLGMMAQQEARWEEAKSNYEQALRIEQESGDRYNQAATYHQLGSVAFEERKWEEASEYLVLAWQILEGYKDESIKKIVVSSLKRMWEACEDEKIRARMREGLGMTTEEARLFFE